METLLSPGNPPLIYLISFSPFLSPIHKTMDDLASQWAQLSLKVKETSTVDLPPLMENNSRVLVAKLFTKRRLNLEAFTQTLQSMWLSAKNFEVRDLGSNTVLLIFEDEADTQRILAQGSWTFDKYLISLYKPKGDESADDAMFDHVSFWVQFHNLPLQRMNKATAEAIGVALGIVKHVDTSTTGECKGRYLRACIQLDINEPLCRGRMINTGETNPQWVAFQYERSYQFSTIGVAFLIMMKRIVHSRLAVVAR